MKNNILLIGLIFWSCLNVFSQTKVALTFKVGAANTYFINEFGMNLMYLDMDWRRLVFIRINYGKLEKNTSFHKNAMNDNGKLQRDVNRYDMMLISLHLNKS